MVFGGSLSEEVGEYWFQVFRPDFVAFERKMQVIHGHAGKEFSIRIGELVIDVEKAHMLSVGELGNHAVGFDHRFVGFDAVVAWKDGH